MSEVDSLFYYTQHYSIKRRRRTRKLLSAVLRAFRLKICFSGLKYQIV